AREVERDRLDRGRRRTRDRDGGVFLEIRDVRLGEAAHRVDFAGAKLSLRRVDRGDEADDDAIQERTAARPVPRIAFGGQVIARRELGDAEGTGDRKSTRLNSSHVAISYAVFCLK